MINIKIRLFTILLLVTFILTPIYVFSGNQNNDAALIEKAIKEQENISGDIKQEDIDNIKDLSIYNLNLADISYLSRFENLERLALVGNNIVDVSPLVSLTNLKVLNLDANKVGNISRLASLKKLEVLSINQNNADNISCLENLTQLKRLNADGNSISDISVLKHLKNLNALDIRNNKIKDISVLGYIQNIKEVYVSGNPITDYAPLEQIYDFIDCDIEFDKVNKKESTLSNSDFSSLDFRSISNGIEEFDQVYKDVVLEGNNKNPGNKTEWDKSAVELLHNAFYDGEKYVKINNGSFSYSFDGENWSDKKITNDMTNINIKQIIKGDNNYVAIGDKQVKRYVWYGITATSKDGITWRITEWRDIPGFDGIVWDGNKFVIIGYSHVLKSSDGQKWAEINVDNNKSYYHIINWNGQKFIIIGNKGEGVFAYSSTDGMEWENTLVNDEKDIEGSLKFHLFDILWDGQKYIAVGYESPHSNRGHGTYAYIIYSYDGLSWNRCSDDFGHSEIIRNIIKTESAYYAVDRGDTLLSSDDGIAWNLVKANPGYTFKDKIKCKYGYFAIDYFDEIFYSTNDIDWNKTPLDRQYYIQKLFFKGNKIVGFGKKKYDDGSTENAVVVSEDGVTWDKAQLPIFPGNYSIDGIKLCNEYFLLYFVGDFYKGDFYKSKDGISWDKAGYSDRHKLECGFPCSVCFNGTNYILVTSQGVILESTDLENYKEIYKSKENLIGFQKIIWDGSRYCVLKSYSVYDPTIKEDIKKIGIMYSDNLVQWNEFVLDYNYSVHDMFVTKEGYYIMGDKIVLFSNDGFAWERRYYKLKNLKYLE